MPTRAACAGAAGSSCPPDQPAGSAAAAGGPAGAAGTASATSAPHAACTAATANCRSPAGGGTRAAGATVAAGTTDAADATGAADTAGTPATTKPDERPSRPAVAADTAAATHTAGTADTAEAPQTAGAAFRGTRTVGETLSARAAGTTHAARGSGIPVAAEATAATLGKAPSELVGEPTFPAVATEAAGSAGASDAAIATGAAGPAVTDQSRTVAGPTVLTGGTRPTVPAIAIQQSTRPTGLARPAVSAVADQRPANNAWVGALTALSTSCANVALAVSAAAYHPPPEVRAATNCARYAAACALICWYSCAFAPNSAAIAIDTSSAAVGRQRRRRACHERIGRADRRTDPRHICGGRGQKEGCAITNDM